MTRSSMDSTEVGLTDGSLYARDAAVIAVSEHLRFFPLEVQDARGSVLCSPAGRELIDLSAGWGAAAVGYAHPRVVEAIATEAARMPSVGVLSAANPASTRLAENLLEVVPLSAGRGQAAVHLGLSGSDANSAALRAIRAWSDRPGILVFENSYHGGLGPAQHASGFYAADGIAMDPGVEQVPYGDVEAAVAALETERFAAAAVEPIMADGGLIVPSPAFLPALREACDRTGTLLMVDEVKVGMGRTGSLLASGCDGVVADVVTLGKGLGGGMPLSAAIAPRQVWEAAPGASLLTLAGNPVCAAAGLAVLETLEAEGLIGRAGELGQELSAALAGLAGRHELIHDVRSRGIVAGIELRRADGSAADAETAAVVHRAFELGAVAYPVGPESNIIELTPALTITSEQLLHGIELLGQAVADVEGGRIDLQAAAGFGGW